MTNHAGSDETKVLLQRLETLSQIGLICALFLTWKLLQTAREKHFFRETIFLVLSLVIVFGSGSVTSIVTYLFAVLILTTMMLGKRRARHIGLLLLYLLIMGVVSYRIMEMAVLREDVTPKIVEATGRDMTFTGRVDLWTDLLEVVKERPLLGHRSRR